MNRLTSGLAGIVVAGLLAAPLLFPTDAQAIPAFTRQFKTECFTCHTIFPELTEQGENFRRNSYVWLETKAPGSAAPAKKKEKTDGSREYLILSSLPDYVPLSITGTFNASIDDRRPESQGNRFDLATRAIVLDAGGSFNDKLGAWISYNLYTEGGFDHVTGGSIMNANVPSNNKPDINEAFVQARHLWGSPLNAKVGRFTPTLSLWKATNKTSVVSPMATTSYRAGDSPFFVNAATDGVELNSIVKGRLAVAGGVAKIKDQENVSGYGSFAYKFGGADFLGLEAPVNLEAEESIFDYLIATLGGYGYVGANNPGPARQLNNFYRYGFESEVHYQRFRAKLATAFGHDNDPYVLSGVPQGSGQGANSQVYAAEALYLVGSEFIPSFRFEYENNGQVRTRRYIPTLAYAALQNAKLVFEFKHEDMVRQGSDNSVNLSLTASF